MNNKSVEREMSKCMSEGRLFVFFVTRDDTMRGYPKEGERLVSKVQRVPRRRRHPDCQAH